jgi:hypothetical protein
VQALDAAIDEVFGYSESTAITHLLLLLDDEAEFEESNWSILHAAEGIHPASYEQELSHVLPALNETAPGWAEILMARVLNSPSSREAWAQHLIGAHPDRRAVVAAICKRITADDPSFSSKAESVLAARRP